MKLLGPDDEEFILKDEPKADENEAIITEHIRLISQDNKLLGDTLMRMVLHIDVVRNSVFDMTMMEAERVANSTHNSIMDDLDEVTQGLRQAIEEIAKNYAEDEAVKVKQEMEVALMNFERNTKGALARHDKAIDRLYEKRHRNERKGKDAS